MRPITLLPLLAACHGSSSPAPDAATPTPPSITATVTSTRFVTREHMLAAGEMQISGEPFAQAMGRNLADYSRDHVPPDIYFDDSPTAAGPWIDLPGFSTAVESYEYSKQPMNNLAFESGAGTSLVYGPLVNTERDRRGGDRAARRAGPALRGRLERARPVRVRGRHVSGEQPERRHQPDRRGHAAENPLGWPGIWPTNHVFASFDPTIDPTGDIALALRDQLGRRPRREPARSAAPTTSATRRRCTCAIARRRSIRRSRPAPTGSRRGSTGCGR